jgi:hypothetical protein
MLRSNNLPPSAHSLPTQSKRAVDPLPSGWPSNNSKPRTHERKPNNQTSRSYLAYRSIFFQDENAGRGLISLFSHKVHSFFGTLRTLRTQGRDGEVRGPYLRDLWGLP